MHDSASALQPPAVPPDPPPLPIDAPAPPPIPSERPPAEPLGPVSETARVGAVDMLRGVAVLGILWMNIISFALPVDAYVLPMNDALNRYAGEFAGANYVVWLVSHVVFDQKMMAIFSMLFGAGLVLMSDRAATAGGRFAGIYYRRLMWLLALGLVHAYLLWYGDILTAYALCGLILYPLRRWRPRTLMVTGVGVMLVGVLLTFIFGALLWMVREQAQRGEPKMVEIWTQTAAQLAPSPAEVEAQVAAFGGSGRSALRENAFTALYFQLKVLPLMLLWRALGLMLLGMALMKLGVFSAVRSTRFYAGLMAWGYGIGVPLVVWGAFDQVAHGFDMIYLMLVGWHYNAAGSVLVALGHVAAVMLIFRSGALPAVARRLADVGRMALTNYLAQSLICTFLFFGWGLGLFGRFERAWLPLFVVAVWIAQLAWSTWWMQRFRFGPMEWLWRTLTYGKRQPFSRAALSAGTS